MNKKLLLIVAVTLALMVSLVGPAAVLASPPEMVKVLIAFDRQPGSDEEGIVRGAGGAIKYTYHLVPAIAASVPEAAIQGLLRNPRVTRIELDINVYAIDAELDNAWGVEHIGAGAVHDGGNKGTGVKVAIIDTGVDYKHTDLDANYAGGYDFVNNDGDPMDDDGHGTHVAGTVAAEDNDVGVVGVAPEASIYALKVLEGGTGSYSDVIAAIQWAVDNEIQVTNNSYGSSGDPGATVKEAFDTAYYKHGVLHVAAAGNNGIPPGRGDNVIYPARWDSVIAVAATDTSDNRASWSSTGPDVELAAPGVNINSALPGGSYGEMSGTSMASPHVAGTAALVITAGITGNDAVRQQLVDTADDLGDTGLDPKYGYGLVDADEAALPAVPNTSPVADAGGPYTGTEDVAVTFDGSGSYDPDGDPLTYAWDFGDGSTGTGVNPTHVYTAGGTYTVTLVVNDGKVNSEPSTTTADITEVNDPPVADAGPDQSVSTSSTVQLNGAGSYDPDDDPVTYSWAFVSKPMDSTATLSGADTATPTFVADVDGIYEVKLTVSDGELTGTDTVVVAATIVSQPTTVSVASITYATEGGRDGLKHLYVTVSLVDDLSNPVADASVSIRLDNTTTAQSWTGTATTGTDGTVTFSLKSAPSGTYTTTVTNVTAVGLIWDGSTPDNSFTK